MVSLIESLSDKEFNRIDQILNNEVNQTKLPGLPSNADSVLCIAERENDVLNLLARICWQCQTGSILTRHRQNHAEDRYVKFNAQFLCRYKLLCDLKYYCGVCTIYGEYRLHHFFLQHQYAISAPRPYHHIATYI